MTARSSRILGLVIAVAAVAVVAPAIVSNDTSFTSVLSVLALLLVAFVTLFALRVEISTNSDMVRIRLRPFYAKQLPVQNIVGGAVESQTGVGQGYGYRALGKDRRGLLVGGPSIKIETAQKSWWFRVTAQTRSPVISRKQSRGSKLAEYSVRGAQACGNKSYSGQYLRLRILV